MGARTLNLVHEPSGSTFRALDGRHAWARMRGLLGTRSLAADAGAYLEPTSSVHMVGMRYPIDVVWLDRGGRTVRVDSAVAPGLSIRICRGARTALEIQAGRAGRLGVQRGDRWIVR